MPFLPPPPLRRLVWPTSIAMITACTLTGCQSYEPSPLDLGAYQVTLDKRVIDTEPVSAFAQRLHATGEEVPAQFDLSDGISYAEGEVLALFYNPDLRLARLDAGVALATRDTAGLWEDPVFGFDGTEILSSSDPFEFALMGRVTIPISGRLDVEKDRASAAYEAELRRVVDAEWRTRGTLLRRWATWSAAESNAHLLAEVRDRLAKISSIADALETAGELNRIQRRLLRIEVADRSMQAVEMDRQVITAKAAVLEVLGLGPDAASLLLPSFPAATSPDVGDLTARLIESNTELAIHFAQYRIAEDSLRLEIRKQYPDIVIGSGYGTEFNDHRVMFGFSIPIPILNANRGGIAQATAAREVARANAETTFARLLREWDVAHRTSELVQSQRSQYEEIVLPLLDGQASDIARIAELGELDLFVLLETVTRTLDAKRRLIQLHVDELDAATIIRQILGPDSIRHPVPVDEEQDPNHTTTQQTSDAIAGGTP